MWQARESMTEAPVTAVTAAGEQRGPRVWKKREKWTETLYLESLVAPALTTYPQGKALRNSPQPGDKAAQFAALVLTCQTLFCSWKGTRRTNSGSCPGCYSKTLQLNSYGFLLHIHRYLRRRNPREKIG